MDRFAVGVELDGDFTYTITLSGELDLQCRAPVRALVDACLDAGARGFIFDMRDVTLCGSDCIGILLRARRYSGPEKDRLPVAVKPSPQVLRTLEMVGLERELRIIE